MEIKRPCNYEFLPEDIKYMNLSLVEQSILGRMYFSKLIGSSENFDTFESLFEINKFTPFEMSDGLMKLAEKKLIYFECGKWPTMTSFGELISKIICKHPKLIFEIQKLDFEDIIRILQCLYGDMHMSYVVAVLAHGKSEIYSVSSHDDDEIIPTLEKEIYKENGVVLKQSKVDESRINKAPKEWYEIIREGGALFIVPTEKGKQLIEAFDKYEC